MTGRERFVAAIEGRPVDRPPVWLMRQAGRYLPEYRALRAKHGFNEMYRTPDLATEVTLQPIRRFGFDAAILFSDILVVPEALGIAVEFPEGGPQLARTVKSLDDLATLHPSVDPRDALSFVDAALRQLRGELGDETALVGFSGAPWTLACYMVEGRGTKGFEQVRLMAYRQPEVLERLLDRLTDLIADYLVMQVEAGADAVQLFDSWGGQLTPELYARLALPRSRRILERVKAAGGRTIHFVLGNAGFLEQVAGTADVIGIDWHQPLGDAIHRLGPQQAVQGNLDPLALQAPPAEVRRLTRMVVEAGRSARGHVFNVGHGLIPSTPIEGVEAMLSAIRE